MQSPAMGTSLIIDNWMLQDVNAALQGGLSGEPSGEIVLDVQRGTHDFVFVPHAVFQIDALLTFLVSIVFRDILVVDGGFTHVWDKGSPSLLDLRQNGILHPFDFLRAEDAIAEPRKVIVDRLCVTKSILDIQRANERSWQMNEESEDKGMSQLVWGAAGYLARSHVYETPYLGCPFRQAFIRQTGFVNTSRDAVRRVDTVINTKRAKLWRSLSNEVEGAYAAFRLPPVAVEIIGDSHDPNQLIPVALQLREKYKPLRNWLGEYQRALDSQMPQDIRKHVRLLESIGGDVNARYPAKGVDGVEMSVTTNWLPLNVKVEGVSVARLITGVRNRFGVRAMLSRLVFSQQGDKGLRKLLNMFGERNSRLSMETYEHLIRRYSFVSSPSLFSE